jgi:GNAT superfamily N-acetyltransferase
MSQLGTEATIRAYDDRDAGSVRALFIDVNRLLAPPAMRDAFDAYIARSLAEEIDRIPAYYGARGGSFWVATRDNGLVGMFGLEPFDDLSFELRRMYVRPSSRRLGIASTMLRFAEATCREAGIQRLVLSTSELQPEAVGLYHHAEYRLVQEVIAEQPSNKTVGGGIRRYHFEKALS